MNKKVKEGDYSKRKAVSYEYSKNNNINNGGDSSNERKTSNRFNLLTNDNKDSNKLSKIVRERAREKNEADIKIIRGEERKDHMKSGKRMNGKNAINIQNEEEREIKHIVTLYKEMYELKKITY